MDIDPAKIGKDLGEVISLGRTAGVKVTSEVEGKPDVVCHSIGSRLRDVSAQLRGLLERGCHVVSTCEELAFPLDATIREELTQVARSRQVPLLGTGVNPGFVMDKLPLTITAVCQEVQSVEIGHGLGVEFDHVSDEVIQPIVADREVVTQYLRVAPGQVAGVHQTIHGKGRIHVSLELRMYIGAEDVAADRVIITGVPNVEMVIKDGVHGDRATAAMVVNAIPRVVQARAGCSPWTTSRSVSGSAQGRRTLPGAHGRECCARCRPGWGCDPHLPERAHDLVPVRELPRPPHVRTTMRPPTTFSLVRSPLDAIRTFRATASLCYATPPT